MNSKISLNNTNTNKQSISSTNSVIIKQNDNDNNNNYTNSNNQKKHIKLINKKADESLDSLSYFDETHIQKIKNELNTNLKQSQLIVSTGINSNNNNNNANLSIKTSIVNNSYDNEFSTPHNNNSLVLHSEANNNNSNLIGTYYEENTSGFNMNLGCNSNNSNINSSNSNNNNNYGANNTTVAIGAGTAVDNNASNSGNGNNGGNGNRDNGGNRSSTSNENNALCQTTRANLRDSSGASTRKEKKTSVGYRLGKRKLLFEKRRQISDYALIFAMTGVFLMIVETEFSMSLLYTKVVDIDVNLLN